MHDFFDHFAAGVFSQTSEENYKNTAKSPFSRSSGRHHDGNSRVRGQELHSSKGGGGRAWREEGSKGERGAGPGNGRKVSLTSRPREPPRASLRGGCLAGEAARNGECLKAAAFNTFRDEAGCFLIGLVNILLKPDLVSNH